MSEVALQTEETEKTESSPKSNKIYAAVFSQISSALTAVIIFLLLFAGEDVYKYFTIYRDHPKQGYSPLDNLYYYAFAAIFPTAFLFFSSRAWHRRIKKLENKFLTRSLTIIFFIVMLPSWAYIEYKVLELLWDILNFMNSKW